MDYHVSSLALLQSRKCTHAFSCLKTGECPSLSQCKAAEGISTMVLLKNREPLATCPYRMELGHSQFCVCPTFTALQQQKAAIMKLEH